MSVPSAYTLTHALVVGFATLLAVAVWSGEAHAACGDHVVILSKKTTAPGDAGDTPVAPPPCQGPNCSLQQTPPTPLPSAPLDAKPLPLDAVLLIELVVAPVTGRPLFFDPVSIPVHRPSKIFRPPPCG